MKILIRELNKRHPAVLAAFEMVKAHAKHETALPACEEVSEEFPELEPGQVVLLWIGVNASHRAETNQDEGRG